MKQKITNSTARTITIPWGRIIVLLGVVSLFVISFVLMKTFAFDVNVTANMGSSLTATTTGSLALEATFGGISAVIGMFFPVLVLSLFVEEIKMNKSKWAMFIIIAIIFLIVIPWQTFPALNKTSQEQSKVAHLICETNTPESDVKHKNGTNTVTCSLKTVDAETGDAVMQRSTYDFERSDNRDGLAENERTWDYYRIAEAPTE